MTGKVASKLGQTRLDELNLAKVKNCRKLEISSKTTEKLAGTNIREEFFLGRANGEVEKTSKGARKLGGTSLEKNALTNNRRVLWTNSNVVNSWTIVRDISQKVRFFFK